MRPDDGAIGHLHGAVAAAFCNRVKHQVPQPALRPAAELLMRGVPVAKRLWQITPGRTSARDPEHGIERASMVLHRPPIRLTDKRLKGGPLLVGQ
jgi:hypothetical protein